LFLKSILGCKSSSWNIGITNWIFESFMIRRWLLILQAVYELDDFTWDLELHFHKQSWDLEIVKVHRIYQVRVVLWVQDCKSWSFAFKYPIKRLFITSIILHLMTLTKQYRQFSDILFWNFSRIRNPIKHSCYENCYGHTIYNLPFCIHVVPTMGFMRLHYFNLSV
jgi:hypothetical protein